MKKNDARLGVYQGPYRSVMEAALEGMRLRRLNAVSAQSARYTELVNVYKSVGGGWVAEAGKLAPPPGLDVGQSPSEVRDDQDVAAPKARDLPVDGGLGEEIDQGRGADVHRRPHANEPT